MLPFCRHAMSSLAQLVSYTDHFGLIVKVLRELQMLWQWRILKISVIFQVRCACIEIIICIVGQHNAWRWGSGRNGRVRRGGRNSIYLVAALWKCLLLWGLPVAIQSLQANRLHVAIVLYKKELVFVPQGNLTENHEFGLNWTPFRYDRGLPLDLATAPIANEALFNV